MESNIIRSLVVLAIGVAMALAAYAGQAGFHGGDAFGPGGRFEPIHTSVVQGHRLDYRLAFRQPSGQLSPAEASELPAEGLTVGPELVVFLSDPAGELIYSAEVKYDVIGPQGTRIKARALPVEGGFAAGIYCSSRGLYQVQTEVMTAGLDLVDSFIYELR
ncbi:hypothetical protein DESUT3_29320 [Desulfuromonas versatilis]|uniref:Uncharacterized protein n=1 Tax=Desulfuromonas versatilis TaxID=2802975 RepID=A0ABM8HYS1_9BACT|nr:hypothetical protein [Desulfuromonas versatilis]BCR05863.1 hypothetical protein DESUT3_29320 [Desulfuromonas versatilis]